MKWSVSRYISFTLSAFLWSASTINTSNDKVKSCMKSVEGILKSNSPDLAVNSNHDGLNKFDNNKLHITVLWGHLDAMFPDKSCIASYLLEYGPYSFDRSKRETSRMDSLISPALSPDTTRFNIELEEGCKVYSIHIVIIPSDTSSDLVYSKPKRFWPIAHKTEILTNFDSSVVTWPEMCRYVTKDWQLEACPDGHTDRCAIMKLNGESPIHLTGLQSCTFYRFRLRSQESLQSEAGDILWSFPTAKTLPKVEIEVTSGKKLFIVRVKQSSNCDPSALLRHFRVTLCKINEDLSHDTSSQYYFNDEGEGSGNHLDDEEIIGNDYANIARDDGIKCTNKVYNLDHGASEFTISDVRECSVYRIDVAPADETGQVLEPVETDESVLSTLCANEPKEKDGGIWFSEDNQQPKNFIDDHPINPSQDHKEIPKSDSLPLLQIIVLASLSGIISLVTSTAIIWILRRTRSRSLTVRHTRCPSETEDGSPKRSLINAQESRRGST